MTQFKIKQCSEIKAKYYFSLSINRSKLKVKAGDIFWITSTELLAKNHGVVEIARINKSTRYPITVENLNRYFEEVAA